MKTLALFRHAKSDWSDPRLEDFDRPLAPRGIKAAPRMAKEMKKLGLAPDLVLCSEAVRTRQTWDLAAPEIGATPRLVVQRRLYLAAPGELLEAVREVGPEAETLMLIGHNPGMENLAAVLAGPESDPTAFRRLAKKFPTAALAILTFEIATWRDAGPGTGTLTHFIQPRDLD